MPIAGHTSSMLSRHAPPASKGLIADLPDLSGLKSLARVHLDLAWFGYVWDVCATPSCRKWVLTSSPRLHKTSQSCLEANKVVSATIGTGLSLSGVPLCRTLQDNSSRIPTKSVSGFWLLDASGLVVSKLIRLQSSIGLSIDAPGRWLRLPQNFAGCPKETAFKCARDDLLSMSLSIPKLKPGLLPMLLVELKAHIA